MIVQLLMLGFLALPASANPQANPPKLKLPWGTWQATVHPKDSEIYLFKDVRFGAEPERFSAPSFPNWLDDTVQNITQGISCIQVDTDQLRKPPGGRAPLGEPGHDDVLQTEDCLFLDIYAPRAAFEPEANPLPVVVWIYGGAYAFGSKNPEGPLNSGQSVLRASGYQTIFITGNYRLGAFGWLSGSYMQDVGHPNAGLYDQALLLQWVQKYVHNVGGNKSRVSAWGESAGGGSILHHLIREDGTKDPLFNTFAVQSPAFEWAWDNSRDGSLDTMYRNFSQFADCGFGYDIKCLRETSIESLRRANTRLFNAVRQTGLFPVGPAVDGKWITSIPTVPLSQGKFWKGIDSAIISHCANEAFLFAPKNIDNQTRFDEFLAIFLPGPVLEPQRDEIRRRYNCTTGFNDDFNACIREVVRDASFTCNTRDLFEAYPEKSYMMEYAFPLPEAALHAADLIPLFVNNQSEAKDLALKIGLNESNATNYAKLLEDLIREPYQSYFATFALTGDPNARFQSRQQLWPVGNGANDQLSNVMSVALLFRLVDDSQNTKSSCSFWTGIAKDILAHKHRSTYPEGSGEL